MGGRNGYFGANGLEIKTTYFMRPKAPPDARHISESGARSEEIFDSSKRGGPVNSGTCTPGQCEE